MAFVEVNDVKKSFNNVAALRGVSLKLEAETQYAIRGASGSGKSTLLYLIGGLDRPSFGDIKVDGRNIVSLCDQKLANYRNQFVGFVFQFHFLLPSMNCLNNILLPSKIGGLYNKKMKKEVSSLAEELGVEHCLKKLPYELSGGEQQRINIIRSLSLKPRLLLCDEPTGNLDSENSLKVTHVLKRLSKEYGATLVVVTHDQSIASHFNNEFFIKDGLVV